MEKLQDKEGLRQSWLEKPSAHAATADGISNMIAAGLELYTATANRAFLEQAKCWSDHMIRHYLASEGSAFCFSCESVRDISIRQNFAEDEATPNYNAVMVYNLSRLSFLLGDEASLELAEKISSRFSSSSMNNPLSHATFLTALHDMQNGLRVILFHADDSRETFDSDETLRLLQALFRETGAVPPILHVFNMEDLPAGQTNLH